MYMKEYVMDMNSNTKTVHDRFYDIDCYIGLGCGPRDGISVAECVDIDEVKIAIDAYNHLRGEIGHYGIVEVTVTATYDVHVSGVCIIKDSMLHRQFVEMYPPLEVAGND